MPLFQESIVKKHLSKIDESVIESAYLEYKRVYSPEKIKNIRVAKEEQYQEGFIKDVFGAVLGYSVYPEHPYNIETEKKNETNSKKADGAILKDEKVVGVIELKDNKTKNLEDVKDQAFGYKNNHKECSYVISSNFHKLRFYIDDATEFEEFDLYNLDIETFKRFYLYLCKEGLLDKNLPKLLREETKFHEEEISKKLYKDYSNFKRSFYENAVKNNPNHDKLILFKKSQKFLDRILFLLFAEDKGLVGTNSIVNIVEKWSGADDDYYRPLYEMVNTYFGHLYHGYTYKKTGEVIPQFGGELFAPDDVLEVLRIDDDVLKNDLLVLSKYDFNTDVDVNILGHIFEHSLNEVDDVEAEIRGEQLDKTKSKRKKDGVFYTPKYITKYIVDNTLGKLCSEKRAELKLDQDIAIFEYQKTDGKLNEMGKDLYERLNSYKSWLLTLKVCDPACGSGAFLNQALSFFIEEHKFVDDIIAELTNTPLRLFDTDLQILENNIFGVDINEESIEIAKLSLWLRTAQPGRKLSDLSNNIKCGNSIIDDPTVAGEKAFNWKREFTNVFDKGGFDAIIGNPPYVPIEELDQATKNNIKEKFYQLSRKYDTSVVFKLNCIDLVKPSGFLSFVTTITWQTGENYDELRKFLFKNINLEEIINLPFNVFPDAYVDTGIFILRNELPKETYRIFNFSKKALISNLDSLHFEMVSVGSNQNGKIVLNKDAQSLLEKINRKANIFLLGEVSISTQGLSPSNFEISEERKEGMFPFLLKGQVYQYLFDVEEIAFTKMDDKQNLKKFYDASPKILFRRLINRQDRLTVGYNEEECVFKKDINPFIINDDRFEPKYILSILASKLISFLYVRTSSIATKDDFRQTTLSELRQLPILLIPKESQLLFIESADIMLNGQKAIANESTRFVRYILTVQNNLKISNKIERWYELSFSDFIKEFNKCLNNVKLEPLTKKDEFEWMELFEEKKKQVLDLKSKLEQTDKEIDLMVYELYGLTEEEIQIVENS
jgi:type I restriction-modification system DNA methylase subunit